MDMECSNISEHRDNNRGGMIQKGERTKRREGIEGGGSGDRRRAPVGYRREKEEGKEVGCKIDDRNKRMQGGK